MIYNLVFISVGLCLFVVGNIGIYRYIVKRAVEDYIDLYFTERRQTVIMRSSIGFLKSGDFKNKIFKISPTFVGGKIFNNTYCYVFVKNEFSVEQRYTAKIKTVFLKIYKVELKSGNEKIIVVL